jgi:hypothetical protein
MTEIAEFVPPHGTNILRNDLSGQITVIVAHPKPSLPLRRHRLKDETPDTIRALHGSENIAASASAVRQQLARMLQSPIFIQSERLSRFLQFIIEHVIGGNQSYLKEYVIGSEVYDRKPPYNPSQDSIVRTEARRLRGKLKKYYETEGKDDPIYVYLHPGSYIPVLRYKEALVGFQSAADINDPLLPAYRKELSYLSARISQLELLVEELLVRNQQLRFSLNQIVGLGSAEPPAALNYCSAGRRSGT